MQVDEAKTFGTVFVYGTLKRGEVNHAHVASAHRIEKARTTGRLYALVEGYPALVDSDDGEVHGEVCFFDEIGRVLPTLDALEEVDGGEDERRGIFARELRRVTLASGEEMEAFIYLVRREREGELLRAGARRLDSGSWRGDAAAVRRSPPARRRGSFFLVLLVGLASFVVLRSVLDLATDSRDSPRPGASAPEFRTSTPAGARIDLVGYRDRVVLVDFWATWCPPCVASMPTLERLYREYVDQGFVVLGVNQEAGDEEIVRRFIKSKGVTFPIAMDSGTIAHAYGVRSFPTSFLIGRDGVVRAMYRGPARESLLRRDIEDALARASNPSPAGAQR